MKYQDTPDDACKGEGISRHPHIACAEEGVDGEEDGQVMNDAAPCLRRKGWQTSWLSKRLNSLRKVGCCYPLPYGEEKSILIEWVDCRNCHCQGRQII